MRSINWFGLAAGIVILVVLAVSLYLPWWQLTIGENLIKVNASPVNTNFGVLGLNFTVPLIWALNLIGVLTLTACGLVMLVYSVVPTKPYAKHLLGFSYRKPLYAVAGFAVGLVIIVFAAGSFGLHLPLNGSATVTLPSGWTMGATVSALVSAGFQLPFWLAIVAAGLCVAARLFHGKIGKIPAAAPQPQTQNP